MILVGAAGLDSDCTTKQKHSTSRTGAGAPQGVWRVLHVSLETVCLGLESCHPLSLALGTVQEVGHILLLLTPPPDSPVQPPELPLPTWSLFSNCSNEKIEEMRLIREEHFLQGQKQCVRNWEEVWWSCQQWEPVWGHPAW